LLVYHQICIFTLVIVWYDRHIAFILRKKKRTFSEDAMNDKDKSTSADREHTISSSLYTQRILDFLDKQLERPHEPSNSDFRSIIESVMAEPEIYRTPGLTVIAEHFVNGMQLHLLDLVAIFRRKAMQEGLTLGEYETTLNDVLPETFSAIEKLRKQISIQSLDELVALYNITIKLYTLSSVETAEEAQQWLYDLPSTYIRRLEQAGMLRGEEKEDKKVVSTPSVTANRFINWQTSYTANNHRETQEIGKNEIAVSTPLTEVLSFVPVKIEIRDPKIRSVV
jgi:hypothetical protein